ncbi:MAG: hypothetical protein HQ582_05150 [Planctomycetes bacterium]|nr:hypothetical protein [Planctomycetota bacterium]
MSRNSQDVCRVVAVLCLCLLPSAGVAQDADPSATPQKEYWQLYLRLAGERLECHFTLEMFYPPKFGEEPIYRLFIDDDPDVKSVDALLKKLSKDVKPMAFVRHVDNPSVIHVIDKRLLGLKGYAIEKKATVKYRGTVDMLTAELYKLLGKTINRKRSGGMRDVFDDHVTVVSVNAKNRRVREVLTDCVPLEGYHTVLWRAETRTVDGKPHTTVQYFGPKGHVPFP